MTNSHPDLDDLVLAAFPAEESDPAVAGHLAVCDACRREVEGYLRTVELAREGVAHLSAADDAALARVRAEVLRQTVGDEPARRNVLGPAPQVPPHSPLQGPSQRPGRRWLRVAVAAMAAVVLVVAGVGIGLVIADRPEPARTLAVLLPLGARAQAGSGTATTTGGSTGWTIEIHLVEVSDSPDADYLEAWLMDSAGGDMIALGGLTRHGDTYDGTFTVPANLPLTQLHLVDISAERYDGNPAHSGISLYRGTMT